MFKSSATNNKSRSLRSLNISTPVKLDEMVDMNSNPIPRSTPEVILITKFDFKAETQFEISVGVGEALKLVERKGNGWILVKPIGRLGNAGLIPASYVKIVKLTKDNSTKIDENWLSVKEPEKEIITQTLTYEDNLPQSQSTSSTQSSNADFDSNSPTKYTSLNSSISSASDERHFSFEKENTPNSTFTIDEPLPESGLVRNASFDNGRYWYRVDIAMSDGNRRYLCRYYQDFYKLHCSIIEELRAAGEGDDCIQKLPALPDPIPRPDLQTLSTILLERCQSLNIYIFRIVQNKHKLNYQKILNEWVLPRIGDIETSQKEVLSRERIEELLKPMPTKTTKSPAMNSNSSEIASMASSSQRKASTNSSISLMSISSQTVPSSTAFGRTHSKEVNLSGFGMKRPSLSISTSVTPPLPAPSGNYMKSRSNSSLNSPSNSPMIWQSPTMQQSPVWRKERSSSSPMIPQNRNTISPKQNNFYNHQEPLTYTRQNSFDELAVKSRNFSVPNVPSVSQRQSTEYLKIKVFANNDIFALKVKSDVTLDGIKQSILTRLECDVSCTYIKLYYKNNLTGHFVPLVDSELDYVLNQTKISLKVHLITKDEEMI